MTETNATNPHEPQRPAEPGRAPAPALPEAPPSDTAGSAVLGWLFGNRANPIAAGIALLLLRLAVGGIMLIHGLQKVTPLWGSKGFAQAKGAAAATGLEPALLWAVLLVIAEVGGWLTLLLGLATRVGAALVAAVMVIALLTVHAQDGFFATHVQQMLLVASVALLLAGGGVLGLGPGRLRG